MGIHGIIILGDNMNVEDIVVKKEPKIVFMGTPIFSVPVLEGLIEKYRVIAVVTQSDKKVGREGKICFSPVKKCALDHGIVVLQPTNLKEQYNEILELDPDIIITCAYGKILPKEILDYPKFGCINVHASLLPKYRGGAPIHRAIMNGDKKSGITIMYMAEGMDDGDIIKQRQVEINDTDTTSILHDKLSILGRDLMLEVLPSIYDGTNSRTPQEESDVTFAPIITKSDERIDFTKSAYEIYNKIRGLNDFPGAYFILDGKRIKVYESYIKEEYHIDKLDGEILNVSKDGLEVKVNNGVIVFTILQKEGKPRMNIKEFCNGLRENLVGKVL